MPSQLDANTSSRFVLNPLLVYIGDRQVGPTRGGVTITRAIDLVQPEMDGVNQAIVGMSYKRSDQCTVEFSVVEFSAPNMALGNNNVAATGSTPNFAYAPYANMTMMDSGEYMPSPGLKVYGQFTDTTLGYWYWFVPSGLITVTPEFGAQGEATLKFTITSAALAAAPDGSVYSYGRVAALPTEVGGT